MARSKIIKNNKTIPKNKVVKKYKRANGEGTIITYMSNIMQ